VSASFLSEDFTIRHAPSNISLAKKPFTEGHTACFRKSPMTVIEIRLSGPDYDLEIYTAETTLSCGTDKPTIGWFSRPDWQRGIDIVIIDPTPQNLPSLDR
jgi:hypothetical protein